MGGGEEREREILGGQNVSPDGASACIHNKVPQTFEHRFIWNCVLGSQYCGYVSVSLSPSYPVCLCVRVRVHVGVCVSLSLSPSLAMHFDSGNK